MNYVSSNSGTGTRELLKAQLWPNQQAALAEVERYLAANSARQCMIRMPTGSGKTAVIAVLAQLTASHPKVLLIAPWEHLTDQLHGQVAEGFWEKSKLQPHFTFRQVRQFTPAVFNTELGKMPNAGVLVCTNTTIQDLSRDHPEKYEDLKKWTDLVLVDEGHREPAPKWALAIRGLAKPTVLFSATPYRNDSRLFELDPNHTYCYTFPRAVADKVIRKVVCQPAAWSRGKDEVRSFVEALRNFRADVIRRTGLPANEVKAVVRCGTFENVKHVAQKLQDAGEDVLAVHERFPAGNKGAFRQKVPILHEDTDDPEAEAAVFWVHQWKLMEGLDDPTFRILAIFDRFPNCRNLVQQVGRIVRNPGHAAGQKCFVLTHPHDRQDAFWRSFETYEKGVQKTLDEGRPIYSLPEAIRAERDNLSTFYFDGQFRHHLRSYEVKDPTAFVRMRLSVVVLQMGKKPKLNEVIEAIEDDITAREAALYGKPWKSADQYLQLYEAFEPSEYASDLYLETRIAYVFAWVSGDKLYLADSENSMPEALRELGELLDQATLSRMLPDEDTTIGGITVLNGDLGNHSIRRKTLATGSLDSVPPALSDYHHICTTASGYVEENKTLYRRYVGFTRSRIIQKVTEPVEFQDFVDWLRGVASRIEDQSVEGADSLGRFAEAGRYDGKAKIRHVLFDFEDIDEEPDHQQLVSRQAPANPDTLWNVSPSGAMIGEIAGKYFEASIKWNPKRKIFEVESSDLDRVEVLDAESRKKVPLTDYLNSSQRFRALVGDNSDLIYTQRRFFRPNRTPWRGGTKRFDLIQIVIAPGGLDGSVDEKGAAGDPVWPATSVFGAVADVNRADGVFAAAGIQPDALVCYDISGGPEIADFFAYTEAPKRLIQIQCKVAGDGSVMSASAFHDLCSQTVRYLAFFNPNDSLTKTAADKIDGTWRIGTRARERLLIRPNGTSAKDVHQRFEELVRDPSCQREVWMVMGQGLSRTRLDNAMKKGAHPVIGVRHMVYLLQSTWSTVASIGASLKVFCKT